jgi:SagB-type dehydrogenase family enzyme
VTADAGRTAWPRRLLRLWSLREDVQLETEAGPDGGGDLLLHSPWGTDRVSGPPPVVREALRRMDFGPVSLENVLAAEADPDADPDPDPDREAAEKDLDALMDRIGHLVVRTLRFEDGERLLLSVLPMSPHAAMEPVALEPGRPVRLSGFASLRAEGDGFALESPLSLHRALLHQPEAMSLIGLLGRATTVRDAARGTGMPEEAVREILGELTGAGLTIAAEPDADGGGFAEDRDPVLATWSTVDLLFHTRSTLGRHDGTFGATHAHAGRVAPEPAVRPARPGRRIPLPRPTTAAGSGPSLAELLEAGPRPYGSGQGTPTDDQLGEMLWRSMRVLSLDDDGSPVPYEVSKRPYPGFGGCYPLELYLCVDRCEGLDRAAYHYDPLRHALVVVNDDHETLDGLLRHAQISAGAPEPPPVLVTLTARFPRVGWKFTGPGHALVLRESGAALQTLSLVGASVGLSVAPLGMADIDTDARAFGLDWRAESTVGGLLLTGAVSKGTVAAA